MKKILITSLFLSFWMPAVFSLAEETATEPEVKKEACGCKIGCECKATEVAACTCKKDKPVAKKEACGCKAGCECKAESVASCTCKKDLAPDA